MINEVGSPGAHIYCSAPRDEGTVRMNYGHL